MEYKMIGCQQLCATCEYWAGPRQLDFYGGHVVLPDQSVNGKCVCMNSPYNRSDRFSNTTTCGSYKKWGVLR